MSTIKYQILEYVQNGTSFINVVLPFNVVDSVSDVLIYGKDDDGYQRLPNSLHYNKIKKYIQNSQDDFILPTSIILGGDQQTVERFISDENGIKYINLDLTNKYFHIVDGQHRIYGLREALRAGEPVGDFLLSVIIVLTDAKTRSKELQIFSDINSKSKRINTDLALLAKHDFEIKETNLNDSEVNNHIAIKTAYYLKDTQSVSTTEGKSFNVWENSIKFDIHSEITLGIIGVSIFSQSIKGVIDEYISTKPFANESGKLAGNDLIEYCNQASLAVGDFLLFAWNEVIRIKWPAAFKEDILKNDEGQLVKVYYNKDFYIQKGLGVKSLNPIIGETVKNKGLNDTSKALFKDKIFESKVRIEDWRNGGPFSGFNSESGFSKIKRIILNEESVPIINK